MVLSINFTYEISCNLVNFLDTKITKDAMGNSGSDVSGTLNFCVCTPVSTAKVMTDTIRDFLLADDCAFNAGLEFGMECSVDRFSVA